MASGHPRETALEPRVLLCPDSFKGTFTATQVAGALADGVREAGCSPDLCPLADGGEGTLDVLQTHLGGRLVATPAHDPIGRRIHAEYLRVDDDTAVIESARASGLALVADCADYAEQASTYGTGELLTAAASAGARHLLVTVGGSATTDGGVGALAAIDSGGGLNGARITVLCDVTTPYEDAAATFGPQKGATPSQIASLTIRLHDTAWSLSRDPRRIPHTGCAGGLSGALWANHNATLVPGGEVVMQHARFDTRARAAELIITGEGAVDTQTLQGKLPQTVTARARDLDRPCAIVAGRVNLPEIDQRLGVIAAIPAQTLDRIADAARDLCRKVFT